MSGDSVKPSNTSQASEDQHAVNGSNVRNEMHVGMDKPFLTAVAIALSLFTLFGGSVAFVIISNNNASLREQDRKTVETWHEMAMLSAREAKDAATKADREARMAQYYNIDLEVYMAKKGLKPPPDPWRKNTKGNKP